MPMKVVPIVPADFKVPSILETDEFRLRMLNVHDVVKDYDAVMTSVEHCKTIWGGNWPQGLTLGQNLIDLGWHQKEFQTRRSFAYTVVQPSEAKVLGCAYILPTASKATTRRFACGLVRASSRVGSKTGSSSASRIGSRQHGPSTRWPTRAEAWLGKPGARSRTRNGSDSSMEGGCA